jgi:hypothetical protein
MEAKRLDVKLFVQAGSLAEPSELVSVFHGFIQRSAITDQVIIDVADYSHVVDGPGVMLIGHEGQYGFEKQKGRTGLLFSQRRATVDGFKSALVYGLRHVLRMASLLEKDDALKGRLKWSGQELMLRINDRLLAPNTPETWKAVEPEVRAVLDALFAGAACSVEPSPQSPELFTLHVKAAAPASVDTLLARLPQ